MQLISIKDRTPNEFDLFVCLPLTRVAQRRAVVNDSPADCQRREATEPQREMAKIYNF